MGCTLVAAVIEDGILYAANIGDSRLYRIHGGRIRQVTKDHSYVEEMVARGKMVREVRTITAGKYHYPGNGNRNPCREQTF